MLFYFAGFWFVFRWPAIKPLIYRPSRFVSYLSLLDVAIAVSAFQFLFIVHPFVLSDNRHYTFYFYRVSNTENFNASVLSPELPLRPCAPSCSTFFSIWQGKKILLRTPWMKTAIAPLLAFCWVTFLEDIGFDRTDLLWMFGYVHRTKKKVPVGSEAALQVSKLFYLLIVIISVVPHGKTSPFPTRIVKYTKRSWRLLTPHCRSALT